MYFNAVQRSRSTSWPNQSNATNGIQAAKRRAQSIRQRRTVPAKCSIEISMTEAGTDSITSCKDMRNPRRWFDGTLLCSPFHGRTRLRRMKISGRQQRKASLNPPTLGRNRLANALVMSFVGSSFIPGTESALRHTPHPGAHHN